MLVENTHNGETFVLKVCYMLIFLLTISPHYTCGLVVKCLGLMNDGIDFSTHKMPLGFLTCN